MPIPEGIAVRDRNITTVAALLDNHVSQGLYPSSVIGAAFQHSSKALLLQTKENDVQPFTSITGGQYNGLSRNGEEVNVL